MSDQDSSQPPPSSSNLRHSPFDLERLQSNHGLSNSPASKSLPYRVAQSASGLAHDVLGLRGNDAASTLAANLQMGGKSSHLNAGPSFMGPVTDSLVGYGPRPVPCADPAGMPGPSFRSPFARCDDASRAFEDFASQSPSDLVLQNSSLGSGHDLRRGAAHLHRPQEAGETGHAQSWSMEFGRSNVSMSEMGHFGNKRAYRWDHNRPNNFYVNKHESSFDENDEHMNLTTNSTRQHKQPPSFDFGPLSTHHDQLRALEARSLEERARLHATVPNFDTREGTFPRPNHEASGSVQAQTPQPNQPPSLVDGLRSSLNARRIKLDSPTHEVLPVTLKNYGINEDPAIYSLFVVHDDQETCLGRDDRPLSIFRQLIDEGKKPVFMLRKHAMPLRGSHSGSGQMSGWFSPSRLRSGNMPPMTKYPRKVGEDRLARPLLPENASDVNNPRDSSSPLPFSDQQTSPEAQRGRAWVSQITTAMSAEHDHLGEDQAKQDADDQMNTQEDPARKTECQDHEAKASSEKHARSRTRSPLTAPYHHQLNSDSEPESESESFSQSPTSQFRSPAYEDSKSELQYLMSLNNERLQPAKETHDRKQRLAKERAQEQDRIEPTFQRSVNEQREADEKEEAAKQSRPLRRLKMVLRHVPPPRSIPIPLPPSPSSSSSTSPSPSHSRSQAPYPLFMTKYDFESEPKPGFVSFAEDYDNQLRLLEYQNKERLQLVREGRAG